MDLEKLVELRDLEDVQRVLGDAAKLELDLVHLAAFVQLNQLAEHGRRHEFDGMKIEQQLPIARGFEPDLFELASDLVDDNLVEDRTLLEPNDEDFAGVLQVEKGVLKRFGHAVCPG